MPSGGHSARTIVFDANGNLYVNIGSPSNACQEQTRTQAPAAYPPISQRRIVWIERALEACWLAVAALVPILARLCLPRSGGAR